MTDEEGKPLRYPEVGIHEAFYEDSERNNDSPLPHSITVNAIAPIAEDVEELRVILLDLMVAAFDKPVLTWEEINSSPKKEESE